jgi:V8-like Glu-specific endopeptidase
MAKIVGRSFLRAAPLRVAGCLLIMTAGAVGLPASATAATTGDAVVSRIGSPAQAAAGHYWTPDRLRAAVPVHRSAVPRAAADDPGPPPGTPTATQFTGTPTVGALFFTSDTGSAHFCTASVVDSRAGNLLLTAAHCVSSAAAGGVENLAFVPQYHDGVTPLGVWAVQSISVAPGWAHSADPNLDFAFLTVASAADGRPLQRLTGGNRLGVDRGYDHAVVVIGYPNASDEPIKCRTRSFLAMPHQLQFNCHGYTDGTSGGPWFIDYDSRTGSGTIIGDIGGYHEGGDYEYTSYSPYFDRAILALYLCTA